MVTPAATASESASAGGSEQFTDLIEYAIGPLAREMAGAGGSALVSAELPEAVVAAMADRGAVALRSTATAVWERPDSGMRMFAFGETLRLTGARDCPIGDAARRLRAVIADSRHLGSSATRPRLFGGARFTPGGAHRDPAWEEFGGWQFLLPQVLLTYGPGGVQGNVTIAARPSDSVAGTEQRLRTALARPFQPAVRHTGGRVNAGGGVVSQEQWEATVARAIEEIRAGRYRKVVLARQSVAASGTASPGAGEVLGRLAERYPSCFVFKFAQPGRDWIGASPELLASVEQGTVRAASLAGTRRRSADAALDAELATELLNDPKELDEHAYVASALRAALDPLCSELCAPATPELMTIANIHHLHTPFEGTVLPGIDILDVVRSLHPTPAVGGAPREEAVEAINRLEGMDRGWYAGPIGWMDFGGDGEFAVALRSGLAGDSEATLFAGAGIVEGSVPEKEYAETELKLGPLREALRGR